MLSSHVNPDVRQGCKTLCLSCPLCPSFTTKTLYHRRKHFFYAAIYADLIFLIQGQQLFWWVNPAERDAFLTVMAEVRRVRLRSGALAWRLYEDVAHPERFAEIWVMESWTAGQASIRSCRDALSRTPGRIIGSLES